MTAVPASVQAAIPAFATPRRPERPTHGPLVASVAAALGTPLLQSQQQIADVVGEYDPDTGRFYYTTVILSVPRRGGKTALVIAEMILRTMRQKHQRVSYSAQLGKDSLELLRDIDDKMKDSRVFRGKFEPRYAAGTENLRCPSTNGLIRFLAPGRRTGHGRDNDMVVFDEAWGIDPEVGRQIEVGLLPTMATRPNPQTWIISAAGDLRSVWWDSWLQKGRRAVETDSGEGTAFFEWAASAEDAHDDEDVWRRVHPAVAEGLIPISFLRDQLENVMSPEDFTRAYLNRPVLNVKSVLTPEILKNSRTTEAIARSAPVALSFDVALDRSEASILAAAKNDKGQVLIEVVDQRPGTHWVSNRMKELIARHDPLAVAMEHTGPAGSIADELTRAGLDVTRLQTRDYSSACASFYDSIAAREPRLLHRGESAFMAAAGSAVRRNVGDSWVWGRRASAGSISALVAATCAAWMLDAPPPEKKPEIGIW